jgi:hypothetical protein
MILSTMNEALARVAYASPRGFACQFVPSELPGPLCWLAYRAAIT